MNIKVGDTVYETDGILTYGYIIKEILAVGGKTIYVTNQGLSFDERAIGTSLFLTREEARAKTND